MSYFAATLNVLFREHDLTARELAALTGIKTSAISRIRIGQQAFVAKDDLKKITAVFSINRKTKEKTPYDAAQLIRAHLLDENVGTSSHLVDVIIRNNQGQEVEAKVKMSFESERAWNFVRDRAGSDKVTEKFLVEFAKMIGYVTKKYKE